MNIELDKIQNILDWIKKKILQSIIKDITKELPVIEQELLKLLEEKKNELFQFCKAKLKEAIEEFVKNHLD